MVTEESINLASSIETSNQQISFLAKELSKLLILDLLSETQT